MSRPAAPLHLSDPERAIWEATVGLVATLTPSRVQMLEAYAVERARWLDAEAWVRANGTTIEIRTDKGELKNLIAAPQLKIAREAQDRALRLAVALKLRGRGTP